MIEMDPELLKNYGKDISSSVVRIREKLEDIKSVTNSLSSWNSEAKNEYVNKINGEMEKMVTTIESIESFGDVANFLGTRISSIEDKIKSTINTLN